MVLCRGCNIDLAPIQCSRTPAKLCEVCCHKFAYVPGFCPFHDQARPHRILFPASSVSPSSTSYSSSNMSDPVPPAPAPAAASAAMLSEMRTLMESMKAALAANTLAFNQMRDRVEVLEHKQEPPPARLSVPVVGEPGVAVLPVIPSSSAFLSFFFFHSSSF